MTTIQNNQETEFYAAIGQAITIWSHIEFKLSRIYSQFVRCDSYAALDSFYAMNTFSSKLKLVNAASNDGLPGGEATPGGEKLKQWRNLYNRMDRASVFRNKIAHYQVTKDYRDFPNPDNSNKVDLTKKEYKLKLSHPHLPMRPSEGKANEYWSSGISAADIIDHIQKVNIILGELKDFSDSLRNIDLSRPLA